ncbi:hypothetical protein [Paenibacillus sp. y28]|uniref:hypothetical protein n=1 Tax=Paenibacillus sp. y28 TaxID=3129110 RepID=UPI00301A3A88
MTLLTDGGGKVRAAYRPIRGLRKVMSFFKGVQAKGAFHGTVAAASLNGDTGLLLRQEGRVVMALCFGWDASGSGVEYMYRIRNPDKLAWLNGESAQRMATKYMGSTP